jgi:mannose-6-phosphate isomerase
MDALADEHQYGKTEMWYILEAGPDAFIYYGFKREIGKAEFLERIRNGTLLEVLNAVPVHRGDVFYIPAGTLHAICKDIVIAEIQQSSTVTYRVFDYDRIGADGKPRQLHIEQALKATQCRPPRSGYNFGGHLVRSPYFTVDTVDAPWQGDCDEESFTSILILDGEGRISCGEEEMDCRKGDSLFLSACSGLYCLEGNMKALITRVGTI